MSVTQYIGSRYVPLFADPIEWSSANTYEPLTIVLHEGNSYTSKQAVPKGIDISDEKFWAITGNYNAQVELYRRETAAAKDAADDAQADIDTLLPKSDFSAENTVKKYVDDSVATVQGDIDTLLPKSDFSAENTVKKYVDDSMAEVQSDIDTLLPKADFSADNTVSDAIAALDTKIEDSVTEIQPPIFSRADAEKFFNNFSNATIPARSRGIHQGIDNDNIYIGSAPSTFAASHQDVAVFMTIADSWLKAGNLLTYGYGQLGAIAYYGNYDNPDGVNPRNFTDIESGRYWIDCETFAQMIGTCTPYAMSPYARGANVSDDIRGINPIYNPVSNEIKPYWNYGSYPDPETYMDSPTNSRRLLTWQFAKALDDANRMNWLTPTNTASNAPRYYQIPQGAIIFSGNIADRYKGIGHCSMLLGTYGDKTYILESISAVDHGRTLNVEDIKTSAITPKGYYMPPYYPTLLPAPYLTNAMTDFYQLSFQDRNLATNPITDLSIASTDPGCVFFGIVPSGRNERMSNVHVKLTPNSRYNGYFMPEDTSIEFDINTEGSYGCFFPASFLISVSLNDTDAANATYNINLMRVQSDRFARMPTRLGC